MGNTQYVRHTFYSKEILVLIDEKIHKFSDQFIDEFKGKTFVFEIFYKIDALYFWKITPCSTVLNTCEILDKTQLRSVCTTDAD